MSQTFFNVWVHEHERITRSLADIGIRVELSQAQEQLQYVLKYFDKKLHEWPSFALATTIAYRAEDYWISFDGFGYLTLVDFSDESSRMEMAEQNYLRYYKVRALNVFTDRPAVETAFHRLGDGSSVTSNSDFGLPKAIQVVPTWSPNHSGYVRVQE